MTDSTDDLNNKLRMLGVQIGVQNLTSSQTKPLRRDMESIFPGGEWINTPVGDVFSLIHKYPLTYSQGISSLIPPSHITPFKCWMKIDLPENHYDPKKLLFLDAETSGLSGGTGTFAFLLGLGYFNAEEFHVQQLFIRNPLDEPGLLRVLEDIVARHETFVTFNGKAFDIPLLRTRCVLNQFPDYFVVKKHIDLLRAARRLWNKRLASKSLSMLENEILHFHRTQDEVPGWMVPEIYFDYLHNQDAQPLQGVFYHNEMDIVSMAALFKLVNDFLNNPFTTPEIPGMDMAEAAQIFHEINDLETAIALYQKSIDQELPQPFLIQTLDKFARLYRNQGQMEKALELWKLAASCDQINACIELAKYYEHRTKDISAAMHWTEQAAQNVGKPQFLTPNPPRLIIKKEIDHRYNRLKKKAGKNENIS